MQAGNYFNTTSSFIITPSSSPSTNSTALNVRRPAPINRESWLLHFATSAISIYISTKKIIFNNEKLLISAQENAKKIKSSSLISSCKLSAESHLAITGIRKFLKNQSEERLLELLNNNLLNEIASLNSSLEEKSNDLTKDSLSRYLLVDCEKNVILNNVDVLIAIFALEEVRRRKIKNSKLNLSSINESINLSELLYKGIKHYHPVELESLIDSNSNEWLKNYNNHKDIGSTFYPIYQALYIAHKKLTSCEFDIKKTNSSILNKNYSPKEWKSYQKILIRTEQALNNCDLEFYIPSMLGSTVKELQLEVKSTLRFIFHNLNIDSEKMTKEEILDALCSSDIWLSPRVRNEFLDVRHFLALLSTNWGSDFMQIPTSQGNLSIKDLVYSMTARFKNCGVNDSESILSEQLYIRIMKAHEHLIKKEIKSIKSEAKFIVNKAKLYAKHFPEKSANDLEFLKNISNEIKAIALFDCCDQETLQTLRKKLALLKQGLHKITRGLALDGSICLAAPVRPPKRVEGYWHKHHIDTSLEEKNTARSLLARHSLNKPLNSRRLVTEAQSLQRKYSLGPNTWGLFHTLVLSFFQNSVQLKNTILGLKELALAAKNIKFDHQHPLFKLDNVVYEQIRKQSEHLFGAHFSRLGGTMVKGGNIRAFPRRINGQDKILFEFKLTQYAREEVQDHLLLIKNNFQTFIENLPPDLKTKPVVMRGIKDVFLTKNPITGLFRSEQGITISSEDQEAEAVEIEFEGIGKVTLGNTPGIGNLYDTVKVEIDQNLPDGEGLNRMQQMLTMLGMGPVLCPQTEEDLERMKIAQIFRAYFPRKAIKMETEKPFYFLPLKDLKNIIIEYVPEMKEIFLHYDNNPSLVKRIEIYPGREVWGLTDISQKMSAQGALALVSAVGVGSHDVAASCKNVCNILRGGMLSTYDRFLDGFPVEGLSSETDLLSGGGDQAYTSLINTLDVDKVNGTDSNYVSTSHFQIIFDLSLADRIPYAYEEDLAGWKNPYREHIENHVFGKKQLYSKGYRKRKNLIEFSRTATKLVNEVMVKNRIGPEYIKKIVCRTQDSYIQLLTELGKWNLFENIDGKNYILGRPVEEFIVVNKELPV